MKRLIALALCALMLPLSAHAWWNDAWSIRKKITLDTQSLGLAAEVDGAPVLIRLSTGSFDFLSAGENGVDIRFVAEDDKTELPFQIERFDVLNELGFIWVRVPKIAPGNNAQHIWLYYGNERAGAATAMPVYDATQVATWHLNDASGVPQDASPAGNPASAGTVTYTASGLIAGAARLSADGSGLQLDSAALQSATALTFSAWLKPDTTDGELLSYAGLTLTLQAGVPSLDLAGNRAQATVALKEGNWQHLAVVHGPSGAELYIDGLLAARVAGTFAPSGELRVGAGLQGELDEVQLSSQARNADWVRLQAASQGSSSQLVKFNQEETTEGGGEGYFMSTLNNLTLDGWVVVVICIFMLIVALVVMFNKALLISRQAKSNLGFSDAFENLTAALRTKGIDEKAHVSHLEQLARREQDFSDSSLHRIFQVGARELVGRFAASGKSQAGLPSVSANALAAVRASLDAQLTRERQRLDRGMVLLTIAISGGPFLGLLGTVVGVMITFAAVAVAGDVNVNAIAPGIAAALLATVAGLGVAIPALFGYNYLQTRVKEIAVDMNVFVDEFVTKMAETYGD